MSRTRAVAKPCSLVVSSMDSCFASAACVVTRTFMFGTTFEVDGSMPSTAISSRPSMTMEKDVSSDSSAYAATRPNSVCATPSKVSAPAADPKKKVRRVIAGRSVVAMVVPFAVSGAHDMRAARFP